MLPIKKPTRRAKEWLTEDGLTKVKGWAKSGLTDEQIAHNMGIAYSTFRKWRDDYGALSAALKKGKEVVDFEVESALHQSALGYYVEEKETLIEEVDGRRKQKVRKLKKWVPANTTAQIFWLKNRKPADWRDKQETEVTGKDGGAIEIDDARSKLIERLAKGEK